MISIIPDHIQCHISTWLDHCVVTHIQEHWFSLYLISSTDISHLHALVTATVCSKGVK